MIILHLLRQHLLWTILWSRVLEIEIRSEKRKLFWEKEIGSLLCFPIWKDIEAISMQFVQPGMEAATRMVNITDITWNKQYRKNMIGNFFYELFYAMFQKQNDDISCYGKETKRILVFGTVVTQNVTFRRKKTVLRAKNRLLQTHFCSLEILRPPFFLNLNTEKSRIFLSLSLYRHLSFLALPQWWGSRQWRFCRETVLIGPAERIFVHQWARFYFLFLIFYIFFCAVLIGPGRLRGFSFNTGREKKS